MKLNNKGITLTEIIISIALISIVLIFLFSLLVTVNDINDESEVNSTYLVNKSLILKNIESDLRKPGSVTINECSSDGVKDFYEGYGVDIDEGGTTTKYFSTKDKPTVEVTKLKAQKCLKFDYETNGTGYLGIYYYKNRNSYVISYIHDTVKATRELPDFEKGDVNVVVSGSNAQLKNWDTKNITLGIPISGFATLTIPITGSDGKDYSIIVSFYKQ